MLIEELKKIQLEDQRDGKNSPPVKRIKNDDSFSFVEQTLNEMDERELSAEQSGLEAIQKVSSDVFNIYQTRLGGQWIFE